VRDFGGMKEANNLAQKREAAKVRREQLLIPRAIE
jgi:hypothetical protein